MPPKELTGLSFDNVYFSVPSGDGGYEYKPLCHVEHIDLTDCDSMLPRLGEDIYGHFTTEFTTELKVRPRTTKLGWVAIIEMFWHGNLLYLKFPKKGKRKLRRFKRCRRVTLIRLARWKNDKRRS